MNFIDDPINTTDDQDELFDVVNDADEVISQASRAECHINKSLIHRAVAAFVINEQGEIFLQKRSMTKDTYPGHWTSSSSGHVSSGDNYDNTVVRETQEELGVDIPHDQFHCLGKIRINALHETEFNMIYTTYHTGPFQLLKDESETGEWLSIDSLLHQWKQGKKQLTLNFEQVLKTPPIIKKLRRYL